MLFAELLKAMLVEENNCTPEEADRLIITYPDIILQGIMHNSLDATVVAIAMAERKKSGRCSCGFEHQPHDSCDGNPGAIFGKAK